MDDAYGPCESAEAVKAGHGRMAMAIDALVFAVGFGAASIISYAYILSAGRTLTSEQFGVLNTLLGLIAICGFFGSSLQAAVAQAAILNPTRPALSALVRRTARVAFPGMALVTVLAMPFASSIGASVAQVACSAAVAMLIFLASTSTGFVLGIGKVRAQAFITLLCALLQLAIGYWLMSSGFGIIGALSGYLAAYLATFCLAYRVCWSSVAGSVPDDPMRTQTPKLELRASTIATFVLAFCPLSLDQLFVQSFAPSLGGSYAAATIVAKPVFFAAYPIIVVAYPHLMRRAYSRDRTGLFLAATAGVVAVAGAIALAITVSAGQLAALVFSGRYPEVVPYLGRLAFGITCFSVSVLGAHMLIALRNSLGFLPSLLAVVAQVGLYALRHDSLDALVANQMAVYVLQLGLVLALLAVTVARTRVPNEVAVGETTVR